MGLLGFVLLSVTLRWSGLATPAAVVAGTVFLMACWWITEPVPLWVTALAPLVVFPLVGAVPFTRVLVQYFDPVNFLFLGGMWIAAAMEEWGLHRRLALGIVARVGTGPRRIVLGFMLGTAFISLFISNTAAAVMMYPIGMAVLGRFAEAGGPEGHRDPEHRRLGMALMLGIAYAASMGGIGSKIGTGTNLVFVKEARRSLGMEVSFLDWFKVGLPLVFMMIPLAWLYLTRVVAPLPRSASPEGEAAIAAERARQGAMNTGERVALVAFLVAAFFWVFRVPMDFGLFVVPGWSDHWPWSWSDITVPLLGSPPESLPSPFTELLGPRGAESVVAMIVGGGLFFLPVTRRPVRMALPAPRGLTISWGLLVLLGGGFAMAEGIARSGLSATIATTLTGWHFPAPVLGFVVICLLTTALSEVASNTATASILLPLLAASAPGLGLQPMPVMFAATLAASFGFMLPAGTPPNAVVFASGYLTVGKMARAGLVVDVLGAVLIALVTSVLAPWALRR